MSRKRVQKLDGRIPEVTGDVSMSGYELGVVDDLATTLTVDVMLGFTTHKMNFEPIAPLDESERNGLRKIIEEFKVELDYEETFQALANFKRVVPIRWRKRDEFRQHVYRFLYLFDPRSGLEIRPCDRYQSEGRKGGKIVASREWDKGEKMEMLIGCRVELSPEEERTLLRVGSNDFSIIEKNTGGKHSTAARKRQCFLWLGPAAYLNHDCRNNCEITCYSRDAPKHVATRRIHKDDEVFIFYGHNFFGPGNEKCECASCEFAQQGAYRSGHESGTVMSELMESAVSVGGRKQNYLLRGRTRSGRTSARTASNNNNERKRQLDGSDLLCAQISHERHWYPVAMQRLRNNRELMKEAISVLGYTRETMELNSRCPLWQSLISHRLQMQQEKLSPGLLAWLRGEESSVFLPRKRCRLVPPSIDVEGSGGGGTPSDSSASASLDSAPSPTVIEEA